MQLRSCKMQLSRNTVTALKAVFGFPAHNFSVLFFLSPLSWRCLSLQQAAVSFLRKKKKRHWKHSVCAPRSAPNSRRDTVGTLLVHLAPEEQNTSLEDQNKAEMERTLFREIIIYYPEAAMLIREYPIYTGLDIISQNSLKYRGKVNLATAETSSVKSLSFILKSCRRKHF